MGKRYLLTALRRFNDGNAYPRAIEKGESVEVDEITKHQMVKSDRECFTVALVIPKSTAKRAKGKDAKAES